ncbi:MAG: tRNA (adenosine(37)-N6)-dimethylallyltransferase MiaA, partial [Bacteroidales bacterium]|nr:tRNA (adenosine(37)-N6)-dimethylallyltransferase MiaA [Bacteroidales bacterium]
KQNPVRMIRALEVCIQTGQSFSSLRQQQAKKRPFQIQKYALNIPKEQLHERINRRVELMMAEGLEAEARSLYPLRHLNALQTVGYKELFEYFDGRCTLEESVAAIQTHTRQYAKRQMTWFHRDETYQWITSETIPDLL